MIFFIPMILGTLDIEELFVMEILLYTIPFRRGNNKMCFLQRMYCHTVLTLNEYLVHILISPTIFSTIGSRKCLTFRST